MTAPVSLILFDLGGVCVELSGIPTVQRWLSDTMSMETFWKIWIHSPAVQAFESGKMEPEPFAKAIIRELDLPVCPKEFLSHFAAWASRLTPHIKDLLDRLRPHYRIASLSNTNVVHWSAISGHLGLSSFFHQNFPSHLTGLLKPDAAAFLQVVEKTGIPAPEILFLDDHPENIAGAKRCGFQTLHVLTPENLSDLLIAKGLFF